MPQALDKPPLRGWRCCSTPHALSRCLDFSHLATTGGCALFVTLLTENHARMIGNMHGLGFFDESRMPDRRVYLSALHQLRDEGLKGLADLLRREIQR